MERKEKERTNFQKRQSIAVPLKVDKKDRRQSIQTPVKGETNFDKRKSIPPPVKDDANQRQSINKTPLEVDQNVDKDQSSPTPPIEVDVNFDKYTSIPILDISLDVKPRIKNIVQELNDDHHWSWPPQPPKDFEAARVIKRQKWPCLYTKITVDLCSILAIIIGPWELLIALGFMIFPKTFIPALRESSEFCVIFVLVFLFEGFFHTLAGIIGLALRSMRPQVIGFAFVAWPITFIVPLFGIFLTFVSFYTTEEWRIVNEMETHLKGYNYHWYSKTNWDHFQNMAFCCGIDGSSDWTDRAAILQEMGKVQSVPESCCKEKGCGNKGNLTSSMAYKTGCLGITLDGVHVIFLSAIVCMIIALGLSIMGYLSIKEAEDFTGDPIHKLIFAHSNAPSLTNKTKAKRREELFKLLNHYSIIEGLEEELFEEVRKAKEYLGIFDDVDEKSVGIVGDIQNDSGELEDNADATIDMPQMNEIVPSVSEEPLLLTKSKSNGSFLNKKASEEITPKEDDKWLDRQKTEKKIKSKKGWKRCVCT